jgi:hypothetical protein
VVRNPVEPSVRNAIFLLPEKPSLTVLRGFAAQPARAAIAVPVFRKSRLFMVFSPEI